MDYKDYYTILGVPRDADEQTIKSAFRRLARVYHPDVNEDKAGATEKFKEINEAYTVLSDGDKRARYDLFNGRYQQQYSRAAADTAPRAQAQTQQRRTATRTVDEEDLERIMRGFARAYSAAAGRRSTSGAGSDFSDFFEALFGNLRTPSGGAPAPQPSADIAVSTTITLAEVLHGTTRKLNYRDGRQVEVTIPAGIENGTRLRVAGQGERSFGRARGDLYMTVNIEPHAEFERQGNDLHVRINVPHATATQGGEVSVPTLEQAVTLKIPASTRSGQQFRLRGLGLLALQSAATRGDLIVTVMVETRTGTVRRAATRKSRPWLRQLFGGVLAIGGLLALGWQTALGGGNEWPLLVALATALLAHGITAPSRIAIAGSLFSLAGAAWLGSRLEGVEWNTLLAQAWPLFPLAAGVVLLRVRRG